MLILALLLPVELDLQLSADPAVTYLVSARALGGVAPRLTLAGSRRKRPKPAPTRKKRAKSRTKSGRGPAVLSALPRLLGDLLRAIKLRSLSLRGEFGLGDPAMTGQLYGALTPLIYGCSGVSCVQVSLWPNFQCVRLNGDLKTRLRITPIALLPPFLRFVWRAFGPA